MGSPVQKWVAVLTYPWTKIVPTPTVRDVWPQCLVDKDSFWTMANEKPLDAAIPFKSVDEDKHRV